MALGLTRPLIEMSTRNRLEPSGPVQVCNGIVLPFFIAKIKEGEMGGERSTHLDDD